VHFCLPEVFFSRLDALEAANMDANQFVHLLGGKVQMLMQNATQLVQSAIVGQKKKCQSAILGRSLTVCGTL
jgi:hypothetical protein